MEALGLCAAGTIAIRWMVACNCGMAGIVDQAGATARSQGHPEKIDGQMDICRIHKARRMTMPGSGTAQCGIVVACSHGLARVGIDEVESAATEVEMSGMTWSKGSCWYYKAVDLDACSTKVFLTTVVGFGDPSRPPNSTY